MSAGLVSVEASSWPADPPTGCVLSSVHGEKDPQLFLPLLIRTRTVTSVHLDFFLNALSSNTVTLGGVGLQHTNRGWGEGGTQFSP